ncbi:MAG: hypothetical protein IT542_08095 [Rubellimicrobium sp.]|nr:hypothetical protein [Rubellimicrobium sp.]
MRPDPAQALALAAGPDPARAVFAYLHRGIAQGAGSLLTTASVYDLGRMRSRRVWSDDAAAYPLGNFKRVERNRYFDIVLAGRQPFSTLSIGEIAPAFFDWEKIRDLGFGSNMNLPAVAGQEVIGTVNLLHREGHFTPARVAQVMEWQGVATLAFLLLHREGAERATFHGTDAPEGAMEG